MINEVSHWEFEVKKEKEDYDKYKALLDMQKNYEKIVEERGRVEGKIEILVNIVSDVIIPCSKAAKRAGMSREEFMEMYLQK